MQHIVLSLSMRVRGGLSVHSLSENWVSDYRSEMPLLDLDDQG